MAVAKKISFLVNGVDLACALQSFEPTAEVEVLDATVLCGDYRRYQQGFKNGEMAAAGVWEYDAALSDKIHDVMSEAFTTGDEQIVTASFGEIVVGGTALLMNAFNRNFGIEVENGALIMVNLEFQAYQAVDFGRWHMNQQIDEGTVEAASVDNAVSSANGGILHAHLQNDDATDVDIKVQHSSNNSTWVDLAAIPTLSAVREAGSVVIPKGTTVNRYTRVVADVVGGNTVLVSAAFARR